MALLLFQLACAPQVVHVAFVLTRKVKYLAWASGLSVLVATVCAVIGLLSGEFPNRVIVIALNLVSYAWLWLRAKADQA